MKKIRLAYLAPEFLPTWGGVGIYSVNLIKELAKRKDMEIHVITPARGKDYDKRKVLKYFNNKIQIHNISKANDTFFYNFTFQNAVAREFNKLNERYQFDIIHSANLVHMPDIWLKFRKLDIPSVVTVHTTIDSQSKINGKLKLKTKIGEKAPVEILSSLAYLYIKFLQNRYVNRSKNIITVSNWVTSFLPKDKKYRIIPNGIDVEQFRVEKKHNKLPVILFSGRLMSMKGIEVLIEAIKLVLKENDARFIFAGTGNLDRYKKKLKDVPKKNYEFLGYVSHEKINEIYAKSDIFVLPSYTESFPLTILEAMASGCAVIASKVGGIPEMITNGKDGLLFEAGNSKELAKKINFLIENKSVREKISRAAKKTVLAKFTAEKMANETYNFYRSILK